MPIILDQEYPTEECYWCGELIENEPFIDPILTSIFGYVYCSEDCRDDHVNSK